MTDRRVDFVGPFPDPVTGQSVSTAALAARVAAEGFKVHRLNNGPHSLRRGPRYHATRTLRSLRAIWHLICCRSRDVTVYISVDHGLGMLYALPMVLISRLRGRRILLHHHNQVYVDRPTVLAHVMFWLAGPSAFHIAICEAMCHQIRQAYSSVLLTSALSNVHILAPKGAIQPPQDGQDGTFVLGHLSVLSIPKGLKRVIACYERLRDEGLDVGLHLAGPPLDEEAEEVIRELVGRSDPRVSYAGPVYGDQKKEFFESIDCFLFPSAYLNETQGIVNLEAMAAGVPVIALARGCISSDIGSAGGIAVETIDEFNATVLSQVRDWLASPERLSHARSRAANRYRELRRDGEAQVDQVLELL